MKRTLLIAIGLALSAGANASDLWAGAAGGIGVGQATTLGGIVEVGTQDDYFGFSADVHLAYDASNLKPTYAAFANLRFQIPVFLHPYAIAGVGLGNDVPMYTASAQPLWKVGAGLRINPFASLFIDGQAGMISLSTEYLEIAIGLKI